MKLLTIDDIAALLNMPHAYVRDKVVRLPDFPSPAVAVSQKVRRWNLADVEAWIAR